MFPRPPQHHLFVTKRQCRGVYVAWTTHPRAMEWRLHLHGLAMTSRSPSLHFTSAPCASKIYLQIRIYFWVPFTLGHYYVLISQALSLMEALHIKVCGCVGDSWLFFLSGHLYLIGVWLGEDQITNTLKTHVLKKIGLRLQILSSTPYSLVNTIGRTYISS
jgi:hypothetical protein